MICSPKWSGTKRIRYERCESQHGTAVMAKDASRITSSQIQTLPMLVGKIKMLPKLNKYHCGQGSTPRKCLLTPGWSALMTTANAKEEKNSNHILWAKSAQLIFK